MPPKRKRKSAPKNSKRESTDTASTPTRRSKRLKTTTTKDTSNTSTEAPTTPSSSRSSRRLQELLDTPDISRQLVNSNAPWVHSEPRNDDHARAVTKTNTTNAIKAKKNLKWFRGMCKDFSDYEKKTGKFPTSTSKDKRGQALAEWKYYVGSYKYAMANNTETSHWAHNVLKYWNEKYDEALSEFGIELNYTPPHLHDLCVLAEDNRARVILANNEILKTTATAKKLHEIWQTFVNKHKYKSGRPGGRPCNICTGMKMLFYGMKLVKVEGEEKQQREYNQYPMKFILYDFDRNELARFKIARAYGEDTEEDHDDNTSNANNDESENGDDDDNNSENDEDDEIVYPIGFKFQRFFPGHGWYEATVEIVFPNARFVVYSDDDAEGITVNEISKSIKAWEKKCQDDESKELTQSTNNSLENHDYVTRATGDEGSHVQGNANSYEAFDDFDGNENSYEAFDDFDDDFNDDESDFITGSHVAGNQESNGNTEDKISFALKVACVSIFIPILWIATK
ncbi:predicted protein [Chaetoceros tenuissimus]|uniref:Uncharacterized protein n=1 Tax=Chaetoceros tenuissimus TaxID=426638 RepID=A0AAD3HAZ3_9STRA|nr:predicted protein [Chaetoceros tenuissimus]